MYILVHVLSLPNHMDEINKLCSENEILLIEDTCESIGSKYGGKKLGTTSDISTFSFYFGHHMSTIEGGMVCTLTMKIFIIFYFLSVHMDGIGIYHHINKTS